MPGSFLAGRRGAAMNRRMACDPARAQVVSRAIGAQLDRTATLPGPLRGMTRCDDEPVAVRVGAERVRAELMSTSRRGQASESWAPQHAGHVFRRVIVAPPVGWLWMV